MKLRDIEDGRKDIYVSFTNEAHLKISQEMISLLGGSYESMRQDPKEIAAFLQMVVLRMVTAIAKTGEGNGQEL